MLLILIIVGALAVIALFITTILLLILGFTNLGSFILYGAFVFMMVAVGTFAIIDLIKWIKSKKD